MKAFLDEQGFLFIEVPNQDHLHKKTLEPHLYVFSEKGLTYLLGRAGYKLVDISLCGRLIEDLSQASNPAKAKSVSQLIRNLVPVTFKDWVKVNVLRLPQYQSPAKFSEMDLYGPGRQWIRVIAQKNR